jgi:hypothetical protein
VAASGSGQDGGRTSMISVRLAPEEQEVLRAEAAANGETLSQFIRDVLLRRSDALRGTADLRLYPASTTTTTSGLAFEAHDGQIVPRTTLPYVTTIFPAE